VTNELRRGGTGRPSVLISVHQPTRRFLEQMRGCLVMANGGSLLYAGPTRLADASCALSAFFDGASRPARLTRALSPPPGVDSDRSSALTFPWPAAHGASTSLLASGAPPLSAWGSNAAEALLEALADPRLQVQQHIDALLERNRELEELRAAEEAAAASTARAGAPSSLLRCVCSRLPCVEWLGGRSGARRVAKAREAGFLVQFNALSKRHCALALRHPLLLWCNLATVVIVSVLSGFVFWQTGKEQTLDGGVLQLVGMLFFLMLVFTLFALINISMWHDERLLYFQEVGAACYGPLAYLCSKFAYDVVPLRVLPSFLCAAIVYPMAGLRTDGPQFEGDFAKGPGLALMFAVSLALANCIGYTMFSAIGIACRSSTIAVQLASVLALYSFLFCGLLVNKSALAVIAHKLSFPSHVLDALPALSFVYRFIETVLVNELGALPRPMIEIKQKHIPGVPKIPDDVPPVSGANVLAFLGFSTGDAPGEYRSLAWTSG